MCTKIKQCKMDSDCGVLKSLDFIPQKMKIYFRQLIREMRWADLHSRELNVVKVCTLD